MFCNMQENIDKIGRVAVCKKASVFGIRTSEIFLVPNNVIINGFHEVFNQ